MKAKQLVLGATVSVLIALFSAINVQAQQTVIVSETFESSLAGTLNGQSVSGGQTTWNANLHPGRFTRQDTFETSPEWTQKLGLHNGRFWTNAGESAYASFAKDFNSLTDYTVNIGYLAMNGTASVFGINVRGNENSKNGSYWFTKGDNSGHFITVSYVDAAGASTNLGTFTAAASAKSYTSIIADISIVVSGNTQQLFINGIVYDSLTRETQGVVGDGNADRITFFSQSPAGNAANVTIDNISVTGIIPESSSTVALIAVSLVALVAIVRSRKRA